MSFALDGICRFEQAIKKSRFRATAGPVDDEPGARVFFDTHADPSANHNCWAFRIGQTYRFSDDGEPGGTAGKPILQAIDGLALDGVAVLVTRWFGGVLLGSGGLIRAYGGTAAACLRAGPKSERVAMVQARIVCTFSDLALVKARLAATGAVRIDGESFGGDGGEIAVSLPEARAETVLGLVADLTSGRAR
ncbi:IMPACT family protein, partial [Rhizobium sp. TRM95111]|uniref:IMPACT family protein n=1 Tax=Rhizobium alarense TaxID=2846851 RepID=UPI001F455BB4